MASWDQERVERDPPDRQERQHQVRGLLLIAGVVMVLSVLRTGVHEVFPHGWWRLW